MKRHSVHIVIPFRGKQYFYQLTSQPRPCNPQLPPHPLSSPTPTFFSVVGILRVFSVNSSYVQCVCYCIGYTKVLLLRSTSHTHYPIPALSDFSPSGWSFNKIKGSIHYSRNYVSITSIFSPLSVLSKPPELTGKPSTSTCLKVNFLSSTRVSRLICIMSSSLYNIYSGYPFNQTSVPECRDVDGAPLPSLRQPLDWDFEDFSNRITIVISGVCKYSTLLIHCIFLYPIPLLGPPVPVKRYHASRSSRSPLLVHRRRFRHLLETYFPTLPSVILSLRVLPSLVWYHTLQRSKSFYFLLFSGTSHTGPPPSVLGVALV